MVERYEFTCPDCDPDTVSVNHGRYVRFSDYEALRTENERLTAERDHYRERFFLAWAALTPVSEDEKRGMARVLAILESKKKSGTGPVKGEFGLKWSGRLQAFEECREMLRLALASLPKESADG